MIDKLFNIIKKLIPKPLFNWLQPGYHWFLAKLASVIYGNPSEELIVIGVTGTKGKSSTCYMLSRILEATGDRVGMSSGIIFKVGEKEWLNDYKMTMPGRFIQQRLLRDMVKAGCKYAIIETTSEGIKQYRHAGINYDIVLFTNLHPEHIESHGSFKKYREAKGKLFYHLTQKPRKNFFNKKISLVNLDDQNAEYFSFFKADEKYGFGLKKEPENEYKYLKTMIADNLILSSSNTSFSVDKVNFVINQLGVMNAYNSLAAISVARILGMDIDVIAETLQGVTKIPGRVEFIDQGQDYKVVVDYAHDPESLNQLFSTLKSLDLEGNSSKLIHVFGATGGGRDKSKREVMGKISNQNADIIILTNDDPYQENQLEIIDQLAQNIEDTDKLHKIVDRREAIIKALNLAKKDDLVLITGKGSEQAIMLNDGRHDWDDREVVRELIMAK